MVASRRTERSIYGDFDATFEMHRLVDLCVTEGGVQTGPFGSQLHESDYVTVGTPIITVEHIGENFINHDGVPRVGDRDRDRLSKYRLRESDIVFSRVGSVDRRALVRSTEEGWLFSGRCLRVRPDPHRVDPTYLSYFFGLPSFKNHVRAVAVGATMPSLNTAILSNLLICLPPLHGQRAAASVLSALDDKIGVNREMSAALDSLATAMFDEMNSEFAAPDTRPLMSRTEILSGGTPKTSIGSYWNGQIPWVSVVDLSPGPWVVATEKHITQEAVENSAASPLPEKTVVISARGTVGRIAMISREMAINQSCYGLRDIDGYQYYLLQLLRRAVPELRTGAYGSIFDTITRRSFESLMVAALPVSALQSFEHRLTPLYELILANEREIGALTAIRDCLLPGLLRGEISVREAEVLVEGAV